MWPCSETTGTREEDDELFMRLMSTTRMRIADGILMTMIKKRKCKKMKIIVGY